MKLFTTAVAAMMIFAAGADEQTVKPAWEQTAAKVAGLRNDTGVMGFTRKDAPDWMIGRTHSEEYRFEGYFAATNEPHKALAYYEPVKNPDGTPGFRLVTSQGHPLRGFTAQTFPDGKTVLKQDGGSTVLEWHGGYFNENGRFVPGHEVKTLFDMPYGVGQMIMIPVCLLLLYLAIVKGFEPLLLLPIGFGGLLANCPLSGVTSPAMMHGGAIQIVAGLPVMVGGMVEPGGFLHYFFSFGIDTGVFPIMIFMGVGAMTDFGPLIANPRMALLGAAAQFGIFFALFGALGLTAIWPDLGFGLREAASIGIIGGADGPTAIWLTSRLAPDLLGAIAVAAYSYMALVPIIQPPIMKLLTTESERKIRMPQLRSVTKIEKICFPLIVLLLCALLLPSAVPLIGAMMVGNLSREVGPSVARIADTMSNALCNIVTIMLGLSVGSKLACEKFLSGQTLAILGLGLCAFCVGTAAGVLMAKLMNLFSKSKVNPLIGSAGVSAVPMAARVSNKVGLQYDKTNFILMQAMGPNVSGVIGSAVVAGVLYRLCN